MLYVNNYLYIYNIYIYYTHCMLMCVCMCVPHIWDRETATAEALNGIEVVDFKCMLACCEHHNKFLKSTSFSMNFQASDVYLSSTFLFLHLYLFTCYCRCVQYFLVPLSTTDLSIHSCNSICRKLGTCGE